VSTTDSRRGPAAQMAGPRGHSTESLSRAPAKTAFEEATPLAGCADGLEDSQTSKEECLEPPLLPYDSRKRRR
jgi:hypothetical protein